MLIGKQGGLPVAAQTTQLTDLVHSFVKALTLHKLYGPSHPHLLEACRGVVEALRAAAGGEAELTVGIAKDRLFLGRLSLAVGSDAKTAKFIATFHHLGVSHLRLRTALSPEELGLFLDILAREGGSGPEAVQQGLRAAALLGVGLGLLDYTKVTTEQDQEGRPEAEGQAAWNKATEEAVWRKLVLPAAQSGLAPLSAAERSQLLELVEEPQLVRELLDRLEGLPKRPSGAAGKAEVADFFRHLTRLLKTLTPERRQAFIARLSGLISDHRGAATGKRATAGAKAAGADQALEVMAAALASEGKASQRLKTAYATVLGEAAKARPKPKAGAANAATAYLEELFLKRTETPYMSEGYARELEAAPASGSLRDEGCGAELASLLETLEPRNLAVERSRLAVELLGSAGSEADVQALMAVIVQMVSGLLKETRFDEAAELLGAVWRDYYSQDERRRIERVIADDVLSGLEVTPLLEHLLQRRQQKEARERLGALANLFAVKAGPYLLERLRTPEAEVAAPALAALAALGKMILPSVRERLGRARGEYLLRLITLVGAVGGEAEVALLTPLCRGWRRAVRLEAVRALGAVGSPRGVSVLARLLLGWSWLRGQTEVRLEAVRALGSIGNEEAREALLAASQRGRGEVARSCREELARLQRKQETAA
jgi:hypothetical protein